MTERSQIGRRIKRIIVAALILLAGTWVTKPLVRFGIVAAGRPHPSGPHQIVRADITVPLPLPTRTGATAPVALRLTYPLPPMPDAPLIFYGPGWGGTGTDNAVLIAELASRGFVVAAYDDIEHDPASLDASPADTAARSVPLDLDTDAGRARLVAAFDQRVRLQAAKISALLDAVERTPALLPAGVTFAPNRIGVMGASFGGSAAVEAAQRDARFKAVINLDGWIHGDAATRVVAVPFATFNSSLGATSSSDVASADPGRRFRASYDERDRATMRRQVAARADGIDLTIAGAMHPDFTDDLYDPERWMLWRPWRGRPIAPIRMRAIVDAYVIAFFDQHLKGVIQPLLRNSRSPFAEVSLARGTGKP